MNIVILDGYTTNPGDISWGAFEQLGDLTVYDYTDEEEICERVKDADIIISNKTVFSRETLKKITRAKYIGLISTGYNVVDVQAAADYGITVTNAPGYSTDAVAQHTFALLLEMTNAVGLHNAAVHAGEWSDDRRFCFWRSPLHELAEKTLGIIGFGSIGSKVAEIARAFSMNVIYTSRTDKNSGFARFVSADELFKTSDIISLHCPLTDDTKEIINAETLSKMKNTAYIINTARGGLINADDLFTALKYGKIAGAACDVMLHEPPEDNDPLISLQNFTVTPHIAWAAKETRIRLIDIAAKNLTAYLNGAPINKVN